MSDSRRELILPAALGSLTALLHILTASDSFGLFRDELYYLANAEHLGFGYVEHPPLIGWITWLARNIIGESMTALRLLPALAGGLTVFLACLVTRELGGRGFAVGFTGLVTALAPVYVGVFGFLSMNAFDILFWTGSMLILFRLLRTRDLRLWLPFGVVIGVGLENKISPLFLGFGIVIGLLITRDWAHFRSRWIWLGGLTAAGMFLPYVIWQAGHHWPVLVFMENATKYKNLPLSPLSFLGEQALLMNPCVVPIGLAGLACLLISREGRPYRALGWAFLAVLAVMITQRAKPYYFTPIYPLVFAPGAMMLDRLASRAGKWLRPASLAVVLFTGLALAPMAKPLLSVETFVSYQAFLGLEPRTDERQDLERLPQFHADRLGWRELTQTVAGVYHDLPLEDRERACIFGYNYGQAGAIDFYGRELGLPRAISGHNSYHIWGPRGCTGETVVVIGGHRDGLDEIFDSVEPATTFTCRDCMPFENHKTIWVARGLRRPIAEVWPQLGSYN
jgi:hypothetical protein